MDNFKEQTELTTDKPFNKIWLLITLILFSTSFSSFSYSKNPIFIKIKVEETQGLNRPLEYIDIKLPTSKTYTKDKLIVAFDLKSKEIIPAQTIQSNLKSDNANNEIRIIFPISIKELETKEYIIKTKPDDNTPIDTDLQISGDNLNLIVENKYLSANFLEYTGFENVKLGPGQLGSLLLKEFGNIQLARKTPNLKMHWAPNFKKEAIGYKTMGHITSPDSFSVSKGPYYFSLFRSGHIKEYQEISLKGEYRFYAGLPYFIFTSEVLFNNDVFLSLLRNDEMTMDKLFTHVAFPRPNGKIIDLPLYQDDSMTYLDKNPISDDAPWLFFYNKAKSYAFGSIRLQYDNKNTSGSDSPTYNKHTKITASSNDGRYWNRVLIHDKNTMVPKGSKYTETNAYIVFKADKNNPAKKMVYFHKRLTNPVKVSYINQPQS
ncbi:hypothetical protein JYU12_01810 [bacterium AH-315-K03]|nr:hypothetical protein [bacterium AH-315-K03]